MQLTDQQRRSMKQVGAPPQSVDLGLRRLKRLEGATQRVVRTYLHSTCATTRERGGTSCASALTRTNRPLTHASSLATSSGLIPQGRASARRHLLEGVRHPELCAAAAGTVQASTTCSLIATL